MKKAITTLIQPRGWMSIIGRSVFLVLFAWCCIGVQNAFAQDPVAMPANGSSLCITFDECGGDKIRFTDDNTNDGLYSDFLLDGDGNPTTTPRGNNFFTDPANSTADTVVFCPEDKWHHVYVTFDRLDLSPLGGGNDLTAFGFPNGDILIPWDGDIKNDPVGGQVIQGNSPGEIGGWVGASCDPDVNPSGCLSFIFLTNGDNNKGTGWDAWVSCQDRGIDLDAPAISNGKVECGFVQGWVDFPPATLASACLLNDPSQTLTIKNQAGEECAVGSIFFPNSTSPAVTLDLGPGIYTATWVLNADEAKTASAVFTVTAPSLVCNDEVNLSINSGCGIELAVDDLIENPCVLVDGWTYSLDISLNGGGKNITVDIDGNTDGVGTGSGSGTAGEPIVWITKKNLEDAGMSICSGSFDVTVTRTIDSSAGVGQIDCDNGPVTQSCTTTVNYSDKTAPVLQASFPNITFIGCPESNDLIEKVVGDMLMFDNCTASDDIDISTSLSTANDVCAGGMATVTVTATDACGLSSSTEHDIPIQRPTAANFIEGINCDLECTDDRPTSVVAIESVIIDNATGAVFAIDGVECRDTVELSSEEYVCGYITTVPTYEALADNVCGKKEIASFSIIDWCNPKGEISTRTHVLNYTDTTAPTFDVDADTLENTTVAIDSKGCTFDANDLDEPGASDNCSTPDIRMNIFRIEDGEDWAMGSTDLDCDSFKVQWIASDLCHEPFKDADGNDIPRTEDTITQIVVVTDLTQPTALCDDQINVTLNSSGLAWVGAGNVDEGSNDNCGEVTLGVRIEGSGDDFAESVEVSCDLKPGTKVELQVSDAKGNTNVCWGELMIEDKVGPSIDAPADGQGSCDEYHVNLFSDGGVLEQGGEIMTLLNENFGTATVTDNCGKFDVTQSIEIHPGDCGGYNIIRAFEANDPWSGLSAVDTQVISIVSVADWKITFPDDADIACGDDFPEALGASDILTSLGFCDALSVNVEGQLFTGGSDACVKMVRTYTVWNPCGEAGTVYNVNTDNDGGLMVTNDSTNAERIVYVQTIKAAITEGPTVVIGEVDLEINGSGDKDNPSDCGEEKIIEVWAGDCLDNDIPESGLTVVITDADGNELTPSGDMEYNAEGQLLIPVVVEPGTYGVEVWAADGCGNSTGANRSFTFVDAKAPAIWVLNGIATEIMPANGLIDIWANDFIQAVTDCDENVTTGIWHVSKGDAPADCSAVAALGQSVEFDCDYVGTQLVRIYASDSQGNCDYVETYIIIQDNGAACGNDSGGPIPKESQVAGKVINTSGDLIESVSVAVNGTMSDAMTTSASGTYAFTLDNGGDYTITPEKDINPLNGVSTFDLVLISKHILGVDPFDTPYKYIAADVNNNGTVTAFDIVLLRQLILNITSEFTNNPSWRFVDASYNFGSDVATTLAQNFPEIMNINNLEGDKLDNDFVAVKVGDINGSAVPNSLVSSEVRTAAGTLVVTTADRYVEAGETVQVAFTSADIAAVTGYQFTMNYAGLEFTELVEGVAKANNFNTNLRGAIATSWNGNATANEELFTVNFTATTSGALSELLSISSDITTAEAYSDAGEVLDIALEFTGDAAQSVFELTQNTPNPFNGETVIGFTLPQAGAATLKVMNVQGKVIKQITGDYTKGYNQISLNAKELGATGVLHYQLESAEHTATRKMIIIE